MTHRKSEVCVDVFNFSRLRDYLEFTINRTHLVHKDDQKQQPRCPSGSTIYALVIPGKRECRADGETSRVTITGYDHGEGGGGERSHVLHAVDVKPLIRCPREDGGKGGERRKKGVN